MSLDVILRLLAGVALILANAFFVTTEFALTRIRQLPEEEFRDSPALRRAWEMTERLEIYLTGCQLGITSTSILLGVVAEPALTALLEPLIGGLDLGVGTRHVVAVTVAVVLINLIHKIWGEQAPTYLGVERPKLVAKHLAGALYWWTKIMYPVIIAGDGLAKASLRLFGVEITRSWTQEGEGSGEDGGADGAGGADSRPIHGSHEARKEMVKLLGRIEGLPRDRRDEVMAALEIGDRPIREIMVPRDEIAALHVDDGFEQVIELIREHPQTRFPLIGDSPEDFRGVVYVPALLAGIEELRSGTSTLAEIAADPTTIAADTTIATAIDQLQAARQELALVLEEGTVVGLVTTTDAFEAIAGELEDPLDETPSRDSS